METALTIVDTEELEKLEQIIDNHKKSGLEAGKAFLAIRDKKLYRQSHETFEDYLRERWGYTRQYGYMLIDYAQTVETLKMSTMVDKPDNERQTRPLTGLEPKEQVKAWEQATKLADGAPVTGKIVKQAVDMITHKEAKPAPKKAEPEYVEWVEDFKENYFASDEKLKEEIFEWIMNHPPKKWAEKEAA